MVGSYNLDATFEVGAFPSPGETVLARASGKFHGGKGSNQAVQAARLGSAVLLIAAVGDDPPGRAALDLWRLEGIDAGAVVVSGALPTGTAMVLIDEQGENAIVVDPGANLALTPESVVQTLSALDPRPAMLVTQLETPMAVALAAFRWAQEAHVTTLLNAAPSNAPLPGPLIFLTDILVVNEVEALALVRSAIGEADAFSAARHLAFQVGQAVVLTRGPDGASLFRPGSDAVHVPAPPAEVCDTTGAGDAFIGAFAARYAVGGNLEAAMRWGVATGSFACRGRGATPSYGARDEIRLCFSDLD